MDRLVTIFGGGGFLGRYVSEELLKQGARVRIAERDPRDAWGIRALGGLGQKQFLSANVTKVGTVERAVAGSDVVINLVGILKGDFQGVHVEGAANIARAAATAGVKALVHISALGANPESPSAYARSKAEGEAAVRGAFPAAAILRPSVLFGAEDQFLNRFAKLIALLPAVPVLRGKVQFQPVFVADVARAVAAAALNPEKFAGQTYELGGPEVISMTALHERIALTIGRDPALIDVPDALAEIGIRVGGWLPGAPITLDQWLMLKADNVVSGAFAGLDAFGIRPAPLDSVAERWLVKYRRHGRFGVVSHPA